MKKTRELIEANLKLVDVVCEVCDARIPASSRNPVLGELTTGKPRVLILNKSDLADEEATKAWLGYLRGGAAQTGQAPVHASFALNAMSGQGVKALFGGLERIAAEKAATGTGRALIPLRLMVVGIPNSGKSSLINRLTGRRAAQVGDRPGVTRGKQWLTLENGMQLLDTPGILWPKFEDPDVGLNLAFCGSIRDEIMDIADLGLELIRILARDYAGMLAERYGTQGDGFSVRNSLSTEEALLVMEGIARRRGFVLSGNRIDYERTARTVLDEFRSGKIGRITLEQPPLMYEAKRTV